jgi:hypothetical protein
MAKLFDQQQLSAGVQEFEEHLHRVRARDWTVDCQLAKPQNDPPPPPRREGGRKAVARNAKGAAPAKGNAQPAALSMDTLQSRRLILALAAFVLVTFAGAMSLALTDGAAPTAEENVSAIESDAPSPAAPPTSQATQAKVPPAVSAPASAPAETYVATIRPDGSLAPDTTPHATVATPPAAVPAPSPDVISDIIKSGEQSEPAPSVPADANALGQNPAAAKPAKKRAVAHAANLASVNPAAADGDPAASAANPGDSGHPATAAAKPVAPKPAAAKPRAASVAAAKKIDDAPQRTPNAGDGGGIFEGAEQAVGSLTGAVKKLVGAD